MLEYGKHWWMARTPRGRVVHTVSTHVHPEGAVYMTLCGRQILPTETYTTETDGSACDAGIRQVRRLPRVRKVHGVKPPQVYPHWGPCPDCGSGYGFPSVKQTGRTYRLWWRCVQGHYRYEVRKL